MKCYHCHGTGSESWEQELDGGESTIWRKTKCPRCDGTGEIEDLSSNNNAKSTD